MENFEKIKDMIQAIAACEKTEEIVAALALLPDYREDGAVIILAAAARVIAEYFENTEDTLDQFGKMVAHFKDIINEKKETTKPNDHTGDN